MSDLPQCKRYSVTKTTLPPCCLRIHPTNSELIVLGTYKLEDSGIRHGSIDLYTHIDHTLTLTQTFPTSGAILDIKFNPRNALQLISVDSIGHIMFWRIDEEITLMNDVQVIEDVLITSCFFSPFDDKVLLTFTDGTSGIFDLPSQTFELLSTSHELECWTGAFGENDFEHVVYTGGDDCQLIAHDLRTQSKIWSNKRHHGAGVVSILTPGQDFQVDSNTLWTGSYDDNLRVFDLRAGMPRLIQEENLGGGVWRLIPNPESNKLLVCCMYDGARIVETYENKFTVSKYFKQDHESMCYGGDWSHDNTYVATCSFYDNIIQTWSPM